MEESYGVFKYIQKHYDAMIDAYNMPDGKPGRAAHPQGTRGRRDDDTIRWRERERRWAAIRTTRKRLLLALNAAIRLYPDHTHYADIRRVYATDVPCFAPGKERQGWREERDAVLAGRPRHEGVGDKLLRVGKSYVLGTTYERW